MSTAAFHPGRSGNWTRPLFTLFLIGEFIAQAGCGRTEQVAGMTPAQSEMIASRIVSRQVDAPRTVAGGVERYGTMLVESEAGGPREVDFFLRQELVRGNADLHLEIVDKESGEVSVYDVNDETAATRIQTSNGVLELVANADHSLVVNGQRARDERAAANIVHQSGVMDVVSDASFTVLLDVFGQYLPADVMGRGHVVVVIIVVLWLAGSFYFCSREYNNHGCQIRGMSRYCTDFCRQVGCACW